MSKYDDIINLPHHVSKIHKPMPVEQRAAQFAPFAALSGHHEVIGETARQTQKKIELSEEERHLLSQRLAYSVARNVEVTVTYFVADTRKDGGKYVSVTGRIKRIDEYEGLLILHDHVAVRLSEICSLESSAFEEIGG